MMLFNLIKDGCLFFGGSARRQAGLLSDLQSISTEKWC